jgi:glycosyltransferase EpsD
VRSSERLDPEYARRFHARCVETGLARRMRVVEAAPEAMRALYDGSDVLVSGARFEALGMALREAMARALPVLAWDVGGSAESVRDGQHGYLVKRGDTAGFSERLRRLIEQPALRHALGAAAREHALGFPTWREVQTRFADALAGTRS